VGRLGDEVSRLKQEIDAMGSPRMPAWGHWSEEREREFHQLFDRPDAGGWSKGRRSSALSTYGSPCMGCLVVPNRVTLR
jgi:hypothetical protein